MSNEQKEKVSGKKLPCGGIAIYGIDAKSKQEIQIGYIGKELAQTPYWTDNIQFKK